MSTRYPLNPRIASRAGTASVEWEELPSLPSVLLRRQVPQASYAIATELVQQAQARLRSAPTVTPVWTETMPAILDPLTPSAPLADTRSINCSRDNTRPARSAIATSSSY